MFRSAFSTESNIGYNSNNKIKTKDSNTSMQPLPAAPHIYLSVYLFIYL